MYEISSSLFTRARRKGAHRSGGGSPKRAERDAEISPYFAWHEASIKRPGGARPRVSESSFSPCGRPSLSSRWYCMPSVTSSACYRVLTGLPRRGLPWRDVRRSRALSFLFPLPAAHAAAAAALRLTPFTLLCSPGYAGGIVCENNEIAIRPRSIFKPSDVNTLLRFLWWIKIEWTRAAHTCAKTVLSSGLCAPRVRHV